MNLPTDHFTRLHRERWPVEPAASLNDPGRFNERPTVLVITGQVLSVVGPSMLQP